MANTNLAELNALATKITGQTVAENSIVAALNKIASYYKGSSVAEISNAAALAEIEDNYSVGGGADIQANKVVTITTNTVTEVTPDDGKDGMAKVTVTTNVQPSEPTYTWFPVSKPSVSFRGLAVFFTGDSHDVMIEDKSFFASLTDNDSVYGVGIGAYGIWIWELTKTQVANLLGGISTTHSVELDGSVVGNDETNNIVSLDDGWKLNYSADGVEATLSYVLSDNRYDP